MNSFVLSQSVRAAVLFNRYAIDRYTALHESMTVIRLFAAKTAFSTQFVHARANVTWYAPLPNLNLSDFSNPRIYAGKSFTRLGAKQLLSANEVSLLKNAILAGLSARPGHRAQAVYTFDRTNSVLSTAITK
jgi:hypothetical protein